LGLRPAFLILLSGLLLPTAGAWAGPGCLRCHQPHYAASGSCTSCHRGDGRSERLAIAHRDLIRGKYSWFALAGSPPLRRGEQLLEKFACRRCHTSAGKGNRLASNLDRLAPNLAPEKISAAIRTPALFMPDFRFEDRQIVDLVNAIMAGAAKAGPAAGETPQVVHFADKKQHGENVFEKQCGPCHKVLTQGQGALGKGDIGPNLSGLFSEFYPATLRNNGRWTAEALKKWLENPRKTREHSQMRPVPLKKEEFDQLLALLAVRYHGH
jgi:cytochrome c2